MLVSQILSEKGRAVVSIPARATLTEATKVLTSHRIGAVLILDSHGAPVGILSERDVVRAISHEGEAALKRTVASRMTSQVASCGEEDSVEDVIERMTQGRFRHMPVLKDGRVVGMISIGDVVKTRIEETILEAQALKEYISTG